MLLTRICFQPKESLMNPQSHAAIETQDERNEREWELSDEELTRTWPGQALLCSHRPGG